MARLLRLSTTAPFRPYEGSVCGLSWNRHEETLPETYRVPAIISRQSHQDPSPKVSRVRTKGRYRNHHTCMVLASCRSILQTERCHCNRDRYVAPIASLSLVMHGFIIGTSNFGIADVPLPEDSALINQILWGSIGWSVGRSRASIYPDNKLFSRKRQRPRCCVGRPRIWSRTNHSFRRRWQPVIFVASRTPKRTLMEVPDN